MELTQTELMELQRQASARNARADSARHARLILLLSEGLTWAEIRTKTAVTATSIAGASGLPQIGWRGFLPAMLGASATR